MRKGKGMKCPRCNAQLTDDASFCGICGMAVSGPKASAVEAQPTFRLSEGNDAPTLASLARSAPPVKPPPGEPAGGGQPGTFQPPQAGWAPGPANQPQSDPWQQQPPQAVWAPAPVNQPPQPGVAPASLNNGAVLSPAPRKRRRLGCLWTSLVLLLVLAGGLAGAWFWGVRPYLHNLAQGELEQALSGPENQILLSMLVVPPGVPLPANLKVIHSTEESMNAYLSAHNSDQVQNLHMTITTTGMTLGFTAYGQNCVISAQPFLDNQGQIQVKNVQVQGLLGLIMSNDELTSELNSNLQNFSAQMSHKLSKITLLDHEIDVQLS